MKKQINKSQNTVEPWWFKRADAPTNLDTRPSSSKKKCIKFKYFFIEKKFFFIQEKWIN